MGKKEEISDVMADKSYTAKDDTGKYVFYVGRILKFSYEGSPITIKITRIDRKNKRMWGEHIALYNMDIGMTHYGHDVDSSDNARVWCRDCDVEVSEPATEEGEVKALQRADEAAKLQEEADNKKGRKFRYELLKMDGTIKKFDAGKRKKMGEIQKILGCQGSVAVVPPVYYPQKYERVAMYSDQQANWNPYAEKNPHMVVLPGDPDLDEQKEFYIVGDVLAEIEVMT